MIALENLIKTKRIVKTDKLLLKSNHDLIILNPEYTAEGLAKSLSHIAFRPNFILKVHFPNFKVRFPDLVFTNDNTTPNENYLELKTHRVNFNKVIDLSKMDTASINKPTIIDGSIFRQQYGYFHVKYKKTALTGQVTVVKVIESMMKRFNAVFHRDTERHLRTFVFIGHEYDPMLEVILSMLNNSLDLSLFNILNLVFFTENGLFYCPERITKDNKKLVRKLILSLKDSATDPNHVFDKSELAEIKEDDYKETPLIRDDSDKDPEVSGDDVNKEFEKEELSKEKETDKAKEILVGSEDETDEEDNTAKSSVEITDEVPSEDSITDEEEMMEVLSTLKSEAIGSSEAELQRIKEENAEFLAKYLPKQEQAIAKFKAEADKLASDKELDLLTIDDPSIISENVRTTKANSITKSYYQKQFKQDLLNSIISLNNDPEYPVIVQKIEMVNNSTPMSKVDTLKVEFLDKKFKRHTFTVDIPKMSHDGFLLINGNKKFIAKQATPKPVIKEAHDRVQITTNYRKVFLYRKGEKTSGQVDKIVKMLLKSDFKSIKKTYGNSTEDNKAFPVSIHYNYLASKLFTLTIPSDTMEVEFIFNQKHIRELVGKEKLKDGYLPIAIHKDKSGKILNVVEEDPKSRRIFSNNKIVADSLVEYLSNLITNMKDEEVLEAYKNTKQSLRLSYTEVKIVSTSLTLGILICIYKGLLPALDLYKIKYRVEQKRVAKKDSEIILAFKDLYLYIDNENNTAKEIFINGLIPLNTTSYNLNETFMYAPIYLDYLSEATGSRNTSKALNNFESSMIDPITKEILESLKLPTGFSELLLYGNDLLGSLSHHRKNDLNSYRIRDSEVISVAVYNSLMDSFNNYKRTMRTGIGQTISAKRDDVVKKIQEMPNVEDYSTLNPFQEAEVKSKTTFKGPSGLNSSQAFTAEIRAYHESMLGLYGLYTPIGPEVGINRSMVLNPKIATTRGLVQDFDLEASDATELFSIGELLNVFTPKHSDSPRAIMATVQGKHITPTHKQHPYLVGNGTDKALAHIIGDDFAKTAQDDGVISKIDNKLQLCEVIYKDGSKSIISLKGRPAKNGGGGFFTEVKLNLVEGLKVGSKVKKGQVLAVDPNFFKPMLDGSVGFASGCLTKVAIMSNPETFEDSSIITQKVVENLSSDIINERRVVLGKNTRIINMAKVGDTVQVQDPLIVFEDMGDSGDDALIKDFEKLDDITKDMISEYARSVAKSKFAGELFDIQIYYNCELEEMHPTLRNLVNTYKKTNELKAKVIATGREDEFVHQASTEKINSEKILGDEVDGVVIQFFIKHKDKFKVGDKCCFAIAVKTIVAETIPEGYEPYSEYRPDESVDALVSPMSLVSRMVPDMFLLGTSHKVLLELEKQCIELLES